MKAKKLNEKDILKRLKQSESYNTYGGVRYEPIKTVGVDCGSHPLCVCLAGCSCDKQDGCPILCSN